MKKKYNNIPKELEVFLTIKYNYDYPISDENLFILIHLISINYTNILDNTVKCLDILKSYSNNISKADIFDILEYKNKVIISKDRYVSINKLDSILNRKNNRVLSYMITDNYLNIISKYNIIKINTLNSLNKAILRRNNNQRVYLVVSYESPLISIIKRIYEDNVFLYNDEYIYLKNIVFIITINEKKLSKDNFISKIPIDKIFI